jgi:DNA processing protein
VERFYWAALSAFPGLGLRNLPALVDYFGSARAAYTASREDYLATGLPLEPKHLGAFLRKRRPEYPTELAEFCAREQVQVLCYADPEYPEQLKHTAMPPAALYIQGNLPQLQQGLAMVGSRDASAYGLKVARAFAADLTAAGLVIISGGAKGIDTASHEGALTGGGPTVAVLGCGIDITYPARNASLFARIRENGAVLSEFPPGTPPRPGNFPQRNRIVSGLARGILVVEAAKQSGAMITVGFALEEGRDVFCVPGSIFLPNCAGCHSLIKAGARLVDRPEDILEELLPQQPLVRTGPSLFSEPDLELTPTARQLLNLLSAQPQALEDILEKTGLDLATVSRDLLDLQVKGVVAMLAGQRFYRI